MDFRAYKSQLITGAHVALLFVAVAVFHGVKVGAIFAVACVCGYLNAFAAFRGLLAVTRRRKLSSRTVFMATLSAAASLALGWFGYWQVLALCTFALVIIDGIFLRFAGPPVGTSASAP
jgi:hypothetical protein